MRACTHARWPLEWILYQPQHMSQSKVSSNLINQNNFCLPLTTLMFPAYRQWLFSPDPKSFRDPQYFKERLAVIQKFLMIIFLVAHAIANQFQYILVLVNHGCLPIWQLFTYLCFYSWVNGWCWSLVELSNSFTWFYCFSTTAICL